ncbi:aspartate/glutamate racemase family protein [Methylobacterium aerolatum]|uniref:Asp/Glu/hydantoin racemase n=1 Tax=Methylobacterium aerolatum TaxID=418708 RepID=A0ABU0I570_9HYPH|nr:aspartate/glutamate racemase family protein [Methylobacterium aerolatum]MDQ0449232.1 Asp/Glu/hydantoin racemase [Methylobacterium aerolatum]GJD35418.1 Hydantoin racemase [Methylobacterium aerolatum]
MRILLINPNTSAEITALIAGHVGTMVGSRAELKPVTARFGARYIASRAALAIAGHAALDCLSEHVAGCDVAFLGCFGDPGLLALQEVSPVPVVGMVEASCRAARRIGRYGIVTGGVLWEPILNEVVAGLGLAEGFTGVRTLALTGGDIARDPGAAIPLLAEACRACAAQDGAEAVILGGAALAGLAPLVQPSVPVPVICSVEAGAAATLAAGAVNARRAPVTVESVGLSVPLHALLARDPGA